MAEPSAARNDDTAEQSALPTAADMQALAKLHGFLRSYVPSREITHRDHLNETYRIDLAVPLPEFNTEHAKAYAATDLSNPGRHLMAHVCPPEHTPRHNAIALLQSLTHRYIVPLVASGVVDLSRPEEPHFVIIHERPAGKTLSEFLAEQPVPVEPHYLCDQILAPLAAAIHQFAELGTSHGLVHPHNIYSGQVMMLGPCVLEPCGYTQPFLFEAPERLLAMPAGKGEGSTAQDFYALAIVALMALLGAKHFEGITQEALVQAMFREGVYAALMRGREVPDMFNDFFRGVLVAGPDDRWDYTQIKAWLSGKRFNVLEPPAPTEAVRPFEIGDHKAHTRRQLAWLLSQDWSKMASLAQSGQVTHWAAASLRNKDLADAIGRLSRISDASSRNEPQVIEQLMCILMLLDPQGPIRLKDLAFRMDGLGTLAAWLFAGKEQQDLRWLAMFCGSSLPGYWLERQRKNSEEYDPPAAVAETLKKIDRLRGYIRNAGYGFGIERMLYDLNPELPCLSPLFGGAHIHTIPALLIRLDRMAAAKAGEDDPIDRHIAAFIASRIGITHDLNLHELAALPAMASNRSIVALNLLAIAQKETEGLPLPGLTHWLAVRILPALDSIHSQTLRQKLKTLLIDRARAGYTQYLSSLIVNASYASADLAGFHKARLLYQANAAKIDAYRKGKQIDQQSARVGYSMAKAIAYVAMAFVLLTVARTSIL